LISLRTKAFTVCVVNAFPGTQRNEILRWLSPDGDDKYFQGNRGNLLSKQAKDTGTWFFEETVFKEWFKGKSKPILFCKGKRIPQIDTNSLSWSGEINACVFLCIFKTHFFSSLSINNIQASLEKSPPKKPALAFVYFGYGEPKTQSAEQIMAYLLRQFVQYIGEIPSDLVEELNKKRHEHGFVKNIADLSKWMLKCIGTVESAFLVIDALDEFEVKTDRGKVLEFLSVLGQGDKAKIFLTSGLDVPEPLKEISTTHTIEARDSDIRIFLQEGLESLNRYADRKDKISPEFGDQIIREILLDVNGMFSPLK
jgi:hypothetical protein